jgi:hypothetical protein
MMISGAAAPIQQHCHYAQDRHRQEQYDVRPRRLMDHKITQGNGCGRLSGAVLESADVAAPPTAIGAIVPHRATLVDADSADATVAAFRDVVDGVTGKLKRGSDRCC